MTARAQQPLVSLSVVASEELTHRAGHGVRIGLRPGCDGLVNLVELGRLCSGESTGWQLWARAVAHDLLHQRLVVHGILESLFTEVALRLLSGQGLDSLVLFPEISERAVLLLVNHGADRLVTVTVLAAGGEASLDAAAASNHLVFLLALDLGIKSLDDLLTLLHDAQV